MTEMNSWSCLACTKGHWGSYLAALHRTIPLMARSTQAPACSRHCRVEAASLRRVAPDSPVECVKPRQKCHVKVLPTPRERDKFHHCNSILVWPPHRVKISFLCVPNSANCVLFISVMLKNKSARHHTCMQTAPRHKKAKPTQPTLH
jgi:hypothetical protein